jgi:ATP/maltotriose-dependent transcriptional regulator MalT
VLPGALDAVEAFCERAGRLPEAATGPIGLGVDDVMAPIHLRRGRLDAAVETARRALARRGELGGYLFLGLNAALAGGMAHAARGEDAEARSFFAHLRASADATPLNSAIGADGRFALARLAWLEGRIGETRDLLAELEADGAATPPFAQVLRLLLRAMVEMSRGDHDAAERTLHEAVEREREAPIATVYASAEAMLARLYWVRRRPRAALDALLPLMRACAEAGTPGRILQEGPLLRPILRHAVAVGVDADEARRLLTLLGDEPDAPARPMRTGSAAPLTDRELEVVRLIADGASNAAIAEALGIGLATVKSHVGHAMDKLDASSRTQIVARARHAGLIA